MMSLVESSAKSRESKEKFPALYEAFGPQFCTSVQNGLKLRV